MFTSINRTVFDIPLTWDRIRFEASRSKCRQARRLIDMSVNAQYNKQLKNVFYERLDIEKNTTESQQNLFNQEKKVRILDNLMDVAEQSLDNYFDKRMENVRNAIQEHCNAIQQILREENEHWKEIHTAIDQNLITSDDIHPVKNIEENNSPANIHTIDEVDEEEEQENEHTSNLLNNKTVTPILTQMIRKSRLQSNRRSTIQSTRPSTMEQLIPSKQEQMSVLLPVQSTRRTLTINDTTFLVKLEETRTTNSNRTQQSEGIPTPAENIPPIATVPTAEVDITPSYSQPKPPARLYFSPTLLQDDDDDNNITNEPIQPVLSTIDQNQSNLEKSRQVSRRFGRTFLLDQVKDEEIDKTQDTENIRPKISDEIPFMIQCDPTILPENETHHSEIIEEQKSMIYEKRRTRDVAVRKQKTEVGQPIARSATRRTGRNQKTNKDTTEPIKRQTRKRKQSVSDDGNNIIVGVRKRKALLPLPPPTATSPSPKVKKTRGRKKKEIPIREPSPLPIIDRSKHYSTRFSTRSHRFNNQTLSTTTMTDDENNLTRTKRLRTKSIERTHHEDKQPTIRKTRAKQNKSTMSTRSRRK